MSLLFTPQKVGSIEIRNRLVRAPTHENISTEDGRATDELVALYRLLAQGGAGLIFTGIMYIHPLGRAYRHQLALDRDEVIPGLRLLTDAVHRAGGTVFFQLHHAGRQTTKHLIGRQPMAPSSTGRDPMYQVKPAAMTEKEIAEAIDAFGAAARRAYEAGADGVHVAGGGGYLVNQFLSPFFNRRTDGWGGSDENRFRFLREVMSAVRASVPRDFPVTAKLNALDHTPGEGMTPERLAAYVRWLVPLGLDGLEVTSGTITFSNMHMWLGEVPLREYVASQARWKRPIAYLMMRPWVGRFDLREGWNLDAVRRVRQAAQGVPLFLVGGMRRVEHMEEVLRNGDAEFIALCRPLIREPMLPRKIQDGKVGAASCISCNRCVSAVPNDLPVRCYREGLPQRK